MVRDCWGLREPERLCIGIAEEGALFEWPTLGMQIC